MTPSQLRFEIDQERKLTDLRVELESLTWQPSACVRFVVDEPVKREVFASDFRDRVVHHLYFNAVSPMVEKLLISDTYSCRKGKGTLYGINRLEHHIRSASLNYTADCYVLKWDIQGYFMSIHREILRQRMRAIIEANRGVEYTFGLDAELLLYLTDVITLHDPMDGCRMIGSPRDWEGIPPSKCLSCSPKGVGLPIGDLTSQLYSNVYLDALDQYVKREMKVRHYGHYVDDGFLVSRDRQQLSDSIPVLQEFMHRELRLTMHPKKIRLYKAFDAATKTGEPVPYLGATIYPYYKHLGARTVKKMFRCKDMSWQTMNSYLGMMRHYKAAALSRRLVQQNIADKEQQNITQLNT